MNLTVKKNSNKSCHLQIIILTNFVLCGRIVNKDCMLKMKNVKRIVLFLFLASVSVFVIKIVIWSIQHIKFVDGKLIVAIPLPECYEEIKSEFESENYENTITLLENSRIPRWQRTDWYYYHYSLAKYKLEPMLVRNLKILGYMKVAHDFKPSNKNCCYWLGRMNAEIGEYTEALKYFYEAASCKADSSRFTDDDISADCWIVHILIEQGDIDKAEQYAHTCDEKYIRDAFENRELIKAVCLDNELSDFAKILYLDLYFFAAIKNSGIEHYKEIAENCLKVEGLSQSLIKFLKVHKLFALMQSEDYTACERLLEEFDDMHIGNGFFITKSDIIFLKMLFNKFKSFYYYKTGNYGKMNNSLAIYKWHKYRPLKTSYTYSEDTDKFFEEFKSDFYFAILQHDFKL